MRTVTALFLGIVAVAAAVTGARATQVAYMTHRQLGEGSQLVVRGKVTGIESHWNEKRTKIFTSTRVAVDETYKGIGQGIIDVVQLGGVVGNVRVTVHGALSWRSGEEVILFLEPYQAGVSGPARYQVSGFSQGKFNVTRDARTGKAYVHRLELEDTELLRAPTAGATSLRARMDSVPIEQFINEALGRRTDKE
jgi:hypothetical protein